MFRFKLCVTGHTTITLNTIEQVQQILRDTLDLSEDEPELEIINVLETPQRATEDKVFATPTLVRVAPPPPKRIIGDLSDKRKVTAALELPTCEGSWGPSQA
jgi:circadian clock protein KaiB